MFRFEGFSRNKHFSIILKHCLLFLSSQKGTNNVKQKNDKRGVWSTQI
nr:MAG TPA: hypothetical protein [Caudoviricetes sp.]